MRKVITLAALVATLMLGALPAQAAVRAAASTAERGSPSLRHVPATLQNLRPATLHLAALDRGWTVAAQPMTTAEPAARRTLTMVATAYGPSAQDNYPYGATDYFGRPLRPGDVAVDPAVIPLGTRLYITGYHSPYLPPGGFVAVADDEGGAIHGDRIDIFIDGSEQAVNSFGIQDVKVIVLGR
jgi:3D (Asp-Asp-Asp) domain-containing protein